MPGADLRITACLIIRNEEAFLEGCLRSISGLVDEIVVVDTGSIDSSIEISRRFGAKVLEWAWRDDFAAARNVGLEAANSDWLLYIDADERLIETSPAELRSGLDDPMVFAARVKFRVRSGSTLAREYRLLRNDRRLRFRGTMHESIRPDLQALERSIGARTVRSPATIVHLGYDGDLTAKYRRNLPLLRAAIEIDPDRIYYWNDLAQTLDGLGQTDEAIDISARGLSRPVVPNPADRALRSLLAYTHARLCLQRGDDVGAIIEEGLELCPGNWSLRFLRARVAINRGGHAAAIADLRELLAQDAAAICDDYLAHDCRIFGCYASDLLGVALLRTGDRAGAAEAFARAAEAAPDVPEYRIKALALGDPAARAAATAGSTLAV